MTIRLAILLILILATPCFALRGGPRLMMVTQPVDASGNVNGSVTLAGIGGAGAQGTLGLSALELAVLTVSGQGVAGGQGTVGINAGGNSTSALNGIGGVGSIGSLTISTQIPATASLAGQGASGGNGTLAVTALEVAVLTLSGQGGSGAIGSINIAAGSISNASTSISGLGSAGAPGDISVSALHVAASSLTGQGGSGSHGTVSVSALQMAVLTVSGQGGAGGIASALTTQQNTVIFPSGQGGAGSQGTVSVAALQMAVLTVSGQGGSGGTGTITAAAVLNGSASLTGRGGAGAGGTVTVTGSSASLLEEFFEAGSAPSGWTAGTSYIRYNYATTPAPLQGNYSMVLDTVGTSNSLTVTSASLSAASGDVYAACRFAFSTADPGDNRTIFSLLDASNNTLGGFQIGIDTQLDGLNTGGSSIANFYDVAIDTPVYIKMRFKKGAGSATIDFWTSTDGQNWTSEGTSSNGTSNVDAAKLQFSSSSSSNNQFIYDSIRVSNSDINY